MRTPTGNSLDPEIGLPGAQAFDREVRVTGLIGEIWFEGAVAFFLYRNQKLERFIGWAGEVPPGPRGAKERR